MSKKNYLPMLIIGVAAFIALIALVSHLGSSGSAETVALEDSITDGVSYLKSLEAQDPNDVDTVLKQLRQEKMEAQRQEYREQLEAGTIDVWSLFEDYVVLGDSRAVGFYTWGFLPQERVLAETGATIKALEEHIPDIVKLNPSYIFLAYGLNDVYIGLWPTPEDYTTDFSRIIGLIQAELPDANIIVSSILPATDPAFEQSSALYNIPEYSQAVSEMCKGISNCYFVNNDSIFEEHENMYQPDGIHLIAECYNYWAINLILGVYSIGMDDVEDASAVESSSVESSTAESAIVETGA